MNKVFKSIVNISRRDNAFSYLIHFLYEAFSNEIFNAVANILGTVVIAIFISRGDYGPVVLDGDWLIYNYITSVSCFAQLRTESTKAVENVYSIIIWLR